MWMDLLRRAVSKSSVCVPRTGSADADACTKTLLSFESTQSLLQLFNICWSQVPEEEIFRLLHSMETNNKGLIDYMDRINLYMSE